MRLTGVSIGLRLVAERLRRPLPSWHSACKASPPMAYKGATCARSQFKRDLNGRGRQMDQSDQCFPAKRDWAQARRLPDVRHALRLLTLLATVPPELKRGDKLRTEEPNLFICSVCVWASNTKSALLSKNPPAPTGTGKQHAWKRHAQQSQEIAKAGATLLIAKACSCVQLGQSDGLISGHVPALKKAARNNTHTHIHFEVTGI